MATLVHTSPRYILSCYFLDIYSQIFDNLFFRHPQNYLVFFCFLITPKLFGNSFSHPQIFTLLDLKAVF